MWKYQITFSVNKQTFPGIKNVFIKYNTPLPSSIPVERLFSYASITNDPKSNQLSDANFERRVVLKLILSNRTTVHEIKEEKRMKTRPFLHNSS